jgi:hypothetical protein
MYTYYIFLTCIIVILTHNIYIHTYIHTNIHTYIYAQRFETAKKPLILRLLRYYIKVGNGRISSSPSVPLKFSRARQCTPVIPAMWEAEIGGPKSTQPTHKSKTPSGVN